MGARFSKTDQTATPTMSPTIRILADIADTTWRMFVPTLALAALGLWADTTYATGPWLSLAGVMIGCGIAVLLVKKQFKRINE